MKETTRALQHQPALAGVEETREMFYSL